MTWLAQRRREPEIMDDPGLETSRHVAALEALGRINRVSGTAERLLREVVRLGRHGTRPIRILDVACGDARVLAQVASAAARRGVRVSAHGCDVSQVALERGAEVAARAGMDVTLSRMDVTRDALPGHFDLVACSLFLHHLSDAEAVRFLAGMARAGTTVLVQDLRRTRLGFLMAWAGVRLLSRSDVARVDGPRSVEAAFSLDEVGDLARRAGMAGAEIQRAWPQRFTLRWEAP